jgi:type I restriction enzyme S subunit
MWSLRPEHFKMMYTPVPPMEEQALMVRFLEHANGRIERALRAKRKLIALLNEQKQAIVQRAVTKGLDPAAPLKPSGIPWLGDIPKHWDVRKLRTVSELIVSNVDKHSKANEEPVRLCNYTDVYKNESITEGLPFMRATASKDEIHRFRIKLDDVVITKDSEEWDDIGVPSLVRHEANDLVCGYHLGILRPRPDLIRGEFLLRALQDRYVATQMHVRAKGVTRYGLSHQGIKDTLIPLPSIQEQEAICARLVTELQHSNSAIARTEREIALIQEYRTRLTADVVTGKVDVREVARHLPAEEIAQEEAGVIEDVEEELAEV